jgi:rubrerythrin
MLIGNRGRIDLDSYSKISNKQFKGLVSGLKEIFVETVVETEESHDFREVRLGDFFPRLTWSESEYKILLEDAPTEKKAEKIGRTYMGVRMKECYWLPEYERWRIAKGIPEEKRFENVELFLKEQELKKTKRKKGTIFRCKTCNTYHYPKKDPWISCEICGSELRKVYVKRGEMEELYSKQPRSKYAGTVTLEEMLKKYPPQPDE